MAEPTRSGSSSWVVPTGLRAKLAVACVLMSLIPLAVLVLVAAWFALPNVRGFYHLDRYFPLIAAPDAAWWLFVVIALTVAIALLGGLYLAATIVQPVIRISRAAGQLAEGRSTALPATDPDELGQLTGALKQLTGQIRDDMSQLREFGEQTTHLNQKIQQRMVSLSGLLRLGELISHGAGLPVILELILEQAAGMLGEDGFAFLAIAPMEELPVTFRRAVRIDAGRFGTWNGAPETAALIDATHQPTTELRALWSQLGQPAALGLQPIALRGRVVGVLVVGTAGIRQWPGELVEMSALLAKHASIALENELLLKTTRQLSVRDELTGVYNETYLRQRLDEEIRRAVIYQRPCAYALFALNRLAEFRQQHGEPEAEHVLKQVARLIQESVSEVDRVGRVNGSQLAVLLPERSKREALDMVERIRQRVERLLVESRPSAHLLKVSCGVAENPLDGSTPEQLMDRAGAALRQFVPTDSVSRTGAST